MSGGCPGWTDISGIYILTGVVLRGQRLDTVHAGKIKTLPLRSVSLRGAARTMSMCHRREKIELASSLYLPRRETNTRSRCLAGAEYY